jgi:O-antigen/teichoic acid export membrane protein
MRPGRRPRPAEARLALTGSEQAPRLPARPSLSRLWSRLMARLGDAEHLLVQRLAGTVFVIRVASAALAFGSQVLLARWMGSFEFGIYVYVWTWVLLIGQMIEFGLGTAAQRFIPEYRDRGMIDHLRGFIRGSRWLAFGVALCVSAIAAGLVSLLAPWLDDYLLIPLYLACVALPAYAIAHIQDGIARSYDWMGLAMVPTYIARQILLTLLMAIAYVAHLPMTAETAMVVAGVSFWLPTLVQLWMVDRRLAARIEPGPRRYEFGLWIKTALPIFMVEGFYALLTYTDVLVLQLFRPPDEVAVYYAATKTLALIAFIHYSIAATTAHRFSSYDVAGDRAGLAAFLARTIKWTFWPSLAATVLLLAFGRPILWLFGAEFTSGYHLLFILAFGLLARAAIGPIERLLNMLGEQRVCALVHAGAFVVNLALCFILIPLFGVAGAAIATAIALIFESVWLFVVTKRRLGFHVFIWGRKER